MAHEHKIIWCHRTHNPEAASLVVYGNELPKVQLKHNFRGDILKDEVSSFRMKHMH